MSEKEYFPAKEDFETRPWDEVIEAVEEKSCFWYCNQFCARAAAQEDESKRGIWAFLARLTCFSIDFDSSDGAFGSKIEAFTEKEIALTKELIPLVEDVELRARMADIIWSKQRRDNYEYVPVAVDSYLKSASRLEDHQNWPLCESRIQRAYSLAFSVNNPALSRAVIDHIKGVLDRCNGADPLFLSARMMDLLLEREDGEPGVYAALAEKLATKAEDAGKHFIAREYWTIKARWHALAGEHEAARMASIAAAETHVDEAEERLMQPAAPNLHASGHLEAAIKALRQIPGTQELTRKIHLRMLEFQRKSVAELAQFESGRFDVTEDADKARRMVEGKPLGEALFTLAAMLHPTNAAEAKKWAMEVAKDSPLMSLFPSTRMNAMGRVIARQPGLHHRSPEQAAEALRCKMYERATFSWQMRAVAIIDPARQQISQEHNPGLRDFLSIASDSWFVPHGRERLYARGLHAGAIGDFAVALHLLVPQLEHSLRCLIYDSGAIASGIDPDGIQHEFDLNALLKDSRHSPTLVKLLGEDAVFDLRGVFVDLHGANLRNELAHGLIDFGGFHSSVARYAWWLILRLCCVPGINGFGEHESQDSTSHTP